MSYDEDQTLIPESFEALFQDGRRRLTIAKNELKARYDLCEGMAMMACEACQTLHDKGVDEGEVLERVLQGLLATWDHLQEIEAHWVTRRTAELLGWDRWVPDASLRATDAAMKR